MQLPSNIKKIQKFQNKSYRDIAKLNSKSKEFKTIETNTLNTKLIIISAFFGWAELHQYIDKNYTKRLSIKSKEKMIDKKLPFTCQDIDVALPLLYGDKDMYIKNPERVWIVMIGFLNGMRLEEIAQLHIDDIYQKEGIWVFDINTNPSHEGIEKLVKNNQSIRIIPVHPTLIKLGFIDYIKKMKQQKHPRPWMKLKHGNHGFGRNTAYWFNKEIKKIAEIKDVNKKTFHGTRHTFIQKAKDAKVDIHVYKAIVGHYESDIDYNTYGKAITPEQMLEELVKIEYPIIEEFFTRKLLV
jgi:integrase